MLKECASLQFWVHFSEELLCYLPVPSFPKSWHMEVDVILFHFIAADRNLKNLGWFLLYCYFAESWKTAEVLDLCAWRIRSSESFLLPFSSHLKPPGHHHQTLDFCPPPSSVEWDGKDCLLVLFFSGSCIIATSVVFKYSGWKGFLWCPNNWFYCQLLLSRKLNWRDG